VNLISTYTYAGTGDANPHAPTSINGVAQTYDNNGNLTSAGSQKYTWDYRNRISSVGNGTASSSYGYDYLNQRVRKVFQNATTTYPNKYMSKSAATTTDYIYMGDTIIAEVEVASTTSSGGGGSISTSTIAFDATSTSITTTSSGNITKTWTHTVTGTNPIIVLTADLQQTATGTGSIASATWNGGAFTKATSTRTNAMESEVWYLVATTTGAKTMSVTINGSTTAIRLGASSFTGVSPTWPLDIVKSANGNGGNPSISVTPGMATDAVVSTLSKYGGGGGGGGSTPALVQSTVAHGATSATFGSAVTSGNLIVVGITAYNQTLASNQITDNCSDTYTKAAEAINGTDHAAIYYAKNVHGGASCQVSSGSVDGTIAIHEYSGVSTSNALDKTNTSTGSSNAPTSGNVTTSTSSELYFGVAWSNNSGDTWTAGSGYTLRQQETDNNTYERLATEDAVISSASTTAARFKVTTSDSWADAIATFNPASGGGSATSPDATSSQTTLWKDSAVATFGGASYKIATTSGAITDTYSTAASQDWVMAAIALRPATSTSAGSTGATTTRYFLPDHLNSTNVVTDASGTPIQVLDYYPYGSTRVSQQFSGFNEQKQYIGQYEDPETNLSYLQARFYSNANGEFLSEDPSFLAVGNPSQVKQLTGLDQSAFLADPQQINSYSYGRDNPITNKNPQGLIGVEAAFATPAGFILGFTGQGIRDLRAGQLSPIEDYVGSEVGTAVALNLALDTDGVMAAGAPGIGAAYGAATTQVLKNLDKSQRGYSPLAIVSEAGTAQVFGYLFPDLSGAPVSSLLSYAGRQYSTPISGAFAQLGSALRATSASIAAQVVRGSPSTGAQAAYQGGGGLAGIQKTLSAILGTLNSLAGGNKQGH